jgi:hypothetical protein
MRDKPKLQVTKNYDLFEMHEFNRPLHEDPRLVASMSKVGFMPSSPIQCVRNGNGKLKVVRGHHRLDTAKRLSLPVWFVVDDSKVDLFDLEGGRQQWTAADFMNARASSGHKDCAELIEFRKRHGLTLSTAASLLGGQSAGSGNHVRAVKDGTFRVAKDLTHAKTVVGITDWCRACGVDFATTASFVAAVSACCRVPDFDADVFKHKVRMYGAQMRRRATREDYIDEIDGLYNYAAKSARIPLAHNAKEISRQRKESFGKLAPTTKTKGRPQ